MADPKVHYVTTAIVYPNSRIHVGWGWETLGADWLIRSHRLMGRETYFATGMDEHALKVQRAAENLGLAPKAYCDQMAGDIEKVLQGIGISYDRFIRTTDADHERVVQALIQRAFDKGDIYKDTYDGLYCEGCEAYYTRPIPSSSSPSIGARRS
jgi:methionyl-tRNA synthetase